MTNTKEIKTPWGEIGYITYKRTYARKMSNGSTEEFSDTIERELRGIDKQLKLNLSDEDKDFYRYMRLSLKGSVAGRFMWQLGTKTVDNLGLASLQNCAFVAINDPIRPFTWAMDMLMLGSGVGYSIKKEHVYTLPKVKNKIKIVRQDDSSADFIVPDTREGWVKLLGKVLKAHFYSGIGFSYSTVLIRGKGAPIKGFGGVASGPEDLCWGIEQISNLLNKRSNKKVKPIDCLDIMNIIGKIVVAGNVRRSAQISIGDSDDLEYLRAKRWDLGDIPNWRNMSNNSVDCSDVKLLPNEFWDTYEQGEPYGLVNIELSKKIGRLGETQYPDPDVEGYNPCQPKWATLLTPNGIRTIGEVEIGDEIWSSEGWTKVVNKWSTGVKDVYSYKTNSGEFVGTENHRLLSEGLKVEAKYCESIDYLVGDVESVLHNEQIIMDGLVLGDGGIHKASGNLKLLYIGEDDTDYFKSQISELIVKERKGISPYAWEITTNILADELPSMDNRSIPDRYFKGTPSEVCSFLRGLYSANGSVVSNRVTYKTSSSKLRDQIQVMLSSIGIKSYFTTNKSKDVAFSNGLYTCKESYDINITSDRDKFVKLIGFIQEYKNKKIDTLVKGKSRISSPVQLVEYISTEEVFDLTVDNNSHTYWTGGLNVSNCAEQSLANYETCCLAEIYLPNIESEKELWDVAKMLYRVNKHSLAIGAHSPETHEIVSKNMRMGIGITGVMMSTPEQKSWLDVTYRKLRAYDKEYSSIMGWNPSIKLTTLKPSGTLSLLAGVTPGVHPSPAGPYYIRRMRIATDSPLIQACKANGFPVEFQRNFDGSNDTSTMVVSFPCKLPEWVKTGEQVDVIDQLDMVKEMQSVWSDNSVSVTAYYRKEDIPRIKEYLSNNWKDNFKTLSFLLYYGHGFDQAPYETISKEQYLEMVSKVTPITNVSVLETDISEDQVGCESGVCPVK